MGRHHLLILFSLIFVFLCDSGLADTALQTSQRYTSQRGSRCLDIFTQSNTVGITTNVDPFSESQLRAQEFTKSGEWWFLAKEIQKHLDDASSLVQLKERLKNLGEKSKKIRKEKGMEEFSTFDVLYNILISLDYIRPLAKFKNEITTPQKNEILKYLSQTLDLPLNQRKRASFSSFYKNEMNWESRFLNLMMFEAFFDQRKMDEFLIQMLESEGLNEGVGRGQDRSGWSTVNPSLFTLISMMAPQHKSEFVVKLRDFIERNKRLDKDMSLDGFVRAKASTLRRNGEVLLNLIFYAEIIHLIDVIKTNAPSKSEIFDRIDELSELKNGYKPQLSMATLHLVAKEISTTLSEIGLQGDTYIVGSALSGRFKNESSDIDLIFNVENQDFFKNSFKQGYHGLLLFDKPTSKSLKETAKALWQMQKRVHNILGNRKNENIFSSSGVSVVFAQHTHQQQKDMILFGFSALSNNFSIRINNGNIFLGIYDPITYTNYELDITNL